MNPVKISYLVVWANLFRIGNEIDHVDNIDWKNRTVTTKNNKRIKMENCLLLQVLPVKLKDGSPVSEGDVLQQRVTKDRHVVVRDSHHFYLSNSFVLDNLNTVPGFTFSTLSLDDRKVVGNIFQNPNIKIGDQGDWKSDPEFLLRIRKMYKRYK